MAEHMTWRLGMFSKLAGAFRQAARIMAGTDAPIPGVLPGLAHDEPTLLVPRD